MSNPILSSDNLVVDVTMFSVLQCIFQQNSMVDPLYNRLWSSEGIWCQGFKSALVHAMACRVIDAKSLPESILTYCLLDTQMWLEVLQPIRFVKSRILCLKF